MIDGSGAGMDEHLRKWRLLGLQVVTGLVVAFVRHDLQEHQIVWDSFGQFLISWFIHTIALFILMAIVGASILHLQKFFLGHERKGFKGEIEEIGFHIFMTILVASICILFIAHYVPTYDD
jgi:hypothetical protein